jgi:hypothetical protein
MPLILTFAKEFSSAALDAHVLDELEVTEALCDLLGQASFLVDGSDRTAAKMIPE